MPDEKPDEKADQMPDEQPDEPVADDSTSARSTKDRFREALEAKKHRASHGSAPTTGPAVHPHASPAKPQRTFRRKSG